MFSLRSLPVTNDELREVNHGERKLVVRSLIPRKGGETFHFQTLPDACVLKSVVPLSSHSARTRP